MNAHRAEPGRVGGPTDSSLDTTVVPLLITLTQTLFATIVQEYIDSDTLFSSFLDILYFVSEAVPCPVTFPHIEMNYHLNDRLFNRLINDEHSST